MSVSSSRVASGSVIFLKVSLGAMKARSASNNAFDPYTMKKGLFPCKAWLG
jgi:hypothetical protein